MTVAQLGAKEQELFAAQQARTTFYEAELQRWRENDAACKAFADAVMPAEKSAKKLTVCTTSGSSTTANSLLHTYGILGELTSLRLVLAVSGERSKCVAQYESRFYVSVSLCMCVLPFVIFFVFVGGAHEQRRNGRRAARGCDCRRRHA